MIRRRPVLLLVSAAALAGCDPSGPSTGPSIRSIEPAVATPRDTLTITGSGFAPGAARNRVTVGGAEATVLTASATELTVTAMASGLPCGAIQNVPVVVAVEDLQDATDHPFTGSARHALAVGGSVALHGGDVACNELTEPGRYVISVFNTSTIPTGATAFRLRGSAGAGHALLGGDAVAEPDQVVRVGTETPKLRSRPEEVAHLRLVEENRRLGQRLSARAAPQTSALRTTAAPPAPGAVLAVRIPDLDATDRCGAYRDVAARVVHSGTRGVILEDTLAPLAGQMNDTWRQVGEEYDQVMHEILVDNFGDPLVYDDSLDADRRVLMLFSPVVNAFEAGVAGFVFSGDLFPRTTCASSDQAEIFYGRVPTETLEGNTPAAWRRTMRSTVIHEVKHITSFAHRRAARASVWEESWLEESTARLAEELYARAWFGYGQNGNIPYAQSIHCEVRPSWPECADAPWVMGKHFLAIQDYYEDIERLSPVGRAVSGDWTFYGSGWQLVRWALDHSGQAEPAFIRALISDPHRSGVQNLSARTGRGFAAMLADFTLAMAIDDRPGVTPARAELTMPSWNTRDIFRGFYDDFHARSPEDFPVPFPLLPRQLTFGEFLVDVAALRGGSASILELSGTLGGTQLLQLHSATGGTAPANLGLAIVRVQ